MNNPALSERLHVAIFGRTNVGKSSLINALTSQSLAIVSNVKGTTADPVQKSIELPPLGAVVLIDTAGIDDTTELGSQRIEKSYRVLDKTDIAILVLEYDSKLDKSEIELIDKIDKKHIPYIKVYNKADNIEASSGNTDDIYVSCKNNINIDQLKNRLVAVGETIKKDKQIVADLVGDGDTVVLVTPIDKGAPKGRLILPQQMVIRELVENNNNVVVLQPSQLKPMLDSLKAPPALVITDSQVFGKVAQIVSAEVPLTSFSILMARYKGTLQQAIDSVKVVDSLKENSNILISEGCTHHRQCDDIGRHKIPNWLEEYTGKNISFSFTSGGDFPDDLSEYDLIVHCGGCMLNDTEMKNRSKKAISQNMPMTNYGTLISLLHKTLERSIDMFGFKK